MLSVIEILNSGRNKLRVNFNMFRIKENSIISTGISIELFS